jgi:MraZ protein
MEMVNRAGVRFAHLKEPGPLLDQFFSGSALCVLDTAGRINLPAFVRATLVRRGEDRALLVGAHEVDPCLIAYDRSVVPLLFADLERRRIAEESVAPASHYGRSRRAFGFVEETDVGNGVVLLPPMMRRRARIGARALLIGTGAAFEIWDADIALNGGDPELAEIARFHNLQHAA